MLKDSPEGARKIAQREGADEGEGEARSFCTKERGERSALAQRSARRDTEDIEYPPASGIAAGEWTVSTSLSSHLFLTRATPVPDRPYACQPVPTAPPLLGVSFTSFSLLIPYCA